MGVICDLGDLVSMYVWYSADIFNATDFLRGLSKFHFTIFKFYRLKGRKVHGESVFRYKGLSNHSYPKISEQFFCIFQVIYSSFIDSFFLVNNVIPQMAMIEPRFPDALEIYGNLKRNEKIHSFMEQRNESQFQYLIFRCAMQLVFYSFVVPEQTNSLISVCSFEFFHSNNIKN